MSKCAYCHERKGKRPCPALDGQICSQCCGEHRMTRISCPSDCVYLDTNTEYQQKRTGERFAQARREFYKELFEAGGEKAAALFNLIEVVSFSYFMNRRDGVDGDVLGAIQSLRRSVSPLHIPPAPESVFAEKLKKEYESFAKAEPQQKLDSQMATDVLDRALKFVTEFSGGGIHSQRFLSGLIGYIRTHHPAIAEQLAQQQESGRIVLPGQFTPPAGEALGHPHTHEHPHAHHHHHSH